MNDEKMSPGFPAKVIIDPTHPEAGRGGVVPPEHARQRAGEPSINPSGKPKGTHSVRVALKRKLRRGWQDDEENEDGEKIGKWARQLAEDLADAIDNGDADKVRSIATLMDQTDGKPQEKIEHSGTIKRVSIQLEDTPEDLEPL